MKYFYLPAVLLLFQFTTALGQSSASRVYQILQDKCVQCHNPVSPSGGLDLQGEGATAEMRALDVYNNLYEISPQNTAAAQAGDAYIYPGRVDKSFLFRKINDGLEENLQLGEEEGQSMPPYGQPQLDEVEKELIRQWILFGAPLQEEVVDESLLESYYGGNAIQSFPEGRRKRR